MQRASPSQTNWFDEGGEERATEAGEAGEGGEAREVGEVEDVEDVEEEAEGGADGALCVASTLCVVDLIFVTPESRTLPSTAVSAMELLALFEFTLVARLSLSLSLLQPSVRLSVCHAALQEKKGRRFNREIGSSSAAAAAMAIVLLVLASRTVQAC